MQRISKPPEIRRQELLDAAIAVFLKKGYEATTIRNILAVVGGQTGMLYYYFSSKAELFHAAMDCYIAAYVAQVTAVLEDRERSAPDRLRAAMELAAATLAKFYVAVDQGEAVLSTELLEENCFRFLDQLVEPAAALLQETRPACDKMEAHNLARFTLYGIFGLMHDPAHGKSAEEMARVAADLCPTMERLLGIPFSKQKGD